MTDPTPKHPSDAPAPSLHVDSDWKAQAEAERARLAEREAAMQARAKDAPEGLPPADFRGLVGLLASQAVMGLGTMADPQGRVVVDLEGSRFATELLMVLKEKTKGNLTPEESGELDEILRELQLRFAAITRMIAEQMSKDPSSVRMAAPGAPGAPMGAAPPPAANAPAKPASGASKLIIP